MDSLIWLYIIWCFSFYRYANNSSFWSVLQFLLQILLAYMNTIVVSVHNNRERYGRSFKCYFDRSMSYASHKHSFQIYKCCQFLICIKYISMRYITVFASLLTLYSLRGLSCHLPNNIILTWLRYINNT